MLARLHVLPLQPAVEGQREVQAHAGSVAGLDFRGVAAQTQVGNPVGGQTDTRRAAAPERKFLRQFCGATALLLDDAAKTGALEGGVTDRLPPGERGGVFSGDGRQLEAQQPDGLLAVDLTYDSLGSFQIIRWDGGKAMLTRVLEGVILSACAAKKI